MGTPIRIVAVVASQAGGNTDRLVGRVLEAAGAAPGSAEVAAVHLGAGPLDPTHVEEAVPRLAAAHAVVLGTPMFRATYAAVLKDFLERIPRGGPAERLDGPLRAKAVGVVATGGSHHHFLGADPLIAVLVRYFGAYIVPPVLYGVIRSGGDGTLEPGLVEDATRFGRALAALARAIRTDDHLGDARAQI
jgi:FMN reductase